MGVRTTVVLDEDVVTRVRELARAEGVSFQRKCNDLVREGLGAPDSNEAAGKFIHKTFHMGDCSLPFPLRISDLDAMDDEERLKRAG